MAKPVAQFLTPLRLEDIDGHRARLFDALHYYSADLRGVFVVPAGFETDFASIPRGLWNVLPKRGKHDAPAVLHDAAYRGALLTGGGLRVRLVRALADDLFLEAMRARGVNRVSRRLMYWAVTWWGSGSYRGVPLDEPDDVA